MFRPDLVIALRDPDIVLYPQIFLTELVDQPGEGQGRLVLHTSAQGPKTLRVVLIANVNIFQTFIPMLQDLIDNLGSRK